MLNWLARYAPLRPLLLDAEGRLQGSVLDAGCGCHGLACVSPDTPFVGLEVDFPGPTAPAMVPVRVRPGRLPFADGAFDTVISLDVLEHVPPAERRLFVAELTRVTARRAIVACPSDEAAHIDRTLAELYARCGLPIPGWLSEHDEHGLPSAAEIAHCVTGHDGFVARPLPTTNGLLATMAVVADMFPHFMAEAARSVHAHGGDWAGVFEAASFGDSFRKAWVLERVEPLAPLVDRDRVEETMEPALRYPSCGGELAPACAGCGALVRRLPNGVWDVVPGLGLAA